MGGAVFGEQDFVQYWTAFYFFINGQNPYDVAAAQALQCALGHDCRETLVSYTPPWILIFLAPVLWLPFAVAAKVWAVAGLGLGIAAAVLIADCFGRGPRTVLYALLGVLINVPLLLSMGFGQTGALFLFGGALLIHGRVKTGSLLEQSVALVILSVKPHLFFLLFVALLWDEIRLRRLALIGYFAAVLAVMLLVLIIVNPVVVTGYLAHFFEDAESDGVIGLTAWNTPTIANFIRVGLREFFGERANLSLAVVPLVSVFLLVWWCRRFPVPYWLHRAPPLLVLSLWIAPYGWAYDWTVLGIVQGVLLARLVRDNQLVPLWVATGMIVAMQLGAGYVTFVMIRSLEWLIWLPAAELMLWYGGGRISRTAVRPVGGA